MRSEDQDFTAEFALNLPTAVAEGAGPEEVHSVVLWFDTAFSRRHCADAPALLSTSPHAPQTHWAQTVLILKEPVLLRRATAAVAAGAATACAVAGEPSTAESITGRLSMVRNRSKHRSLDISLEYKAVLSDGRVVQHTAIYAMNVLSDRD